MKLIRSTTILLAATALSLSATACSATSAKVTPTANGSQATYAPQTVTACDRKMTITKPPQRVVVVNSIGVSELSALGLLDRVVARAGDLDTSLYGKSKATLDAIPVLSWQKSSGGNATLSAEALLEKRPDLVIGTIKDTSLVAKLAEAGVATYIPQAMCGAGSATKTTFADADAEVRRVADMFGVPERADAVVADLAHRVEAVPKGVHKGSAVAVYVTPGDNKLWGFGISSMLSPQLEHLGLRNALEEQKQRTLELSMETLLQLDPDYVVIVYQGDGEAAKKSFLASPSTAQLKAVKTGHVVTQNFARTDPPSTLTIDGLEHLSKAIA